MLTNELYSIFHRFLLNNICSAVVRIHSFNFYLEFTFMSTYKVNDPLSVKYEFLNCCLICHTLSVHLHKNKMHGFLGDRGRNTSRC